jgi:hypothetical protein
MHWSDKPNHQPFQQQQISWVLGRMLRKKVTATSLFRYFLKNQILIVLMIDESAVTYDKR